MLAVLIAGAPDAGAALAAADAGAALAAADAGAALAGLEALGLVAGLLPPQAAMPSDRIMIRTMERILFTVLSSFLFEHTSTSVKIFRRWQYY